MNFMKKIKILLLVLFIVCFNNDIYTAVWFIRPNSSCEQMPDPLIINNNMFTVRIEGDHPIVGPTNYSIDYYVIQDNIEYHVWSHSLWTYSLPSTTQIFLPNIPFHIGSTAKLKLQYRAHPLGWPPDEGSIEKFVKFYYTGPDNGNNPNLHYLTNGTIGEILPDFNVFFTDINYIIIIPILSIL